MPTLAIAATGISLRIGNGVSPGGATIGNATNTTPIVITTLTAHGIADVSVVTVTGVLGTTGANGTWTARRTSTTQLELQGSIGNGPYGGGGTVTITETFATIAEVTNISDAGVVLAFVDASAHDGSGWSTRIPTLASGNMVRLDLNFVPTNATHNATTGLNHLMLAKIRTNFLLVFPNTTKTSWRFTGYVAQMREAAPVAGVLTSSVTLEMSDQPILAA